VEAVRGQWPLAAWDAREDEDVSTDEVAGRGEQTRCVRKFVQEPRTPPDGRGTLRPDKVIPTDGGELNDRWVAELYRLGYRDPQRAAPITASKPGALDRQSAVQTILSRLGARRSGWNAAECAAKLSSWSPAPAWSPRPPYGGNWPRT